MLGNLLVLVAVVDCFCFSVFFLFFPLGFLFLASISWNLSSSTSSAFAMPAQVSDSILPWDGAFNGQSDCGKSTFYLQQRIFQEIQICHLHVMTLRLPSRSQPVMFGEDEAVRQGRTLVGDLHLHPKHLTTSAP